MPPLDPLDYIPGQTGQDAGLITPLDLTPYFGDPDAPDAVTLSVTAGDLPVGLIFDPLTNTISGTPSSNASQLGDPGAPGVYTIPVTATIQMVQRLQPMWCLQLPTQHQLHRTMR